MISRAPDVRTYIDELPPDRQPVIRKLRGLCRRQLRGYEESMEYGMPVYKRSGVMEISFASQKGYVALYVMKKPVLDEFREALAASSTGKGCVRFTKPEKIDFGVVERLLRKTVESESKPC